MSIWLLLIPSAASLIAPLIHISALVVVVTLIVLIIALQPAILNIPISAYLIPAIPSQL